MDISASVVRPLSVPQQIDAALDLLLDKTNGLFIKAQQRRPRYLKDGDIVESRLVSQDGKLNLGVQCHQIVREG